MAPENQQSESATESTETVGQAQENPTQDTPRDAEIQSREDNTQGNESHDSEDSRQSQDKDPAKEALLSDLHKERDRRKTLTSQVEELTTELSEARKTVEELRTLEAKYSRLEAFILQAGGALGQALDSKSFTEALFNSDQEIPELVAQWHKKNPTATTAALRSGASVAQSGNDLNSLLRAASR